MPEKPGKARCRDCDIADPKLLKPSLLHSGEWICKNREDCANRIARKVQGKRGQN